MATAVEEVVAYGLAHRDLEIDEIARKRGHVYVTNVYDLERKRLVWSGEGRFTETVEAFFDVLGPEKMAALAGICCDRWQSYIDVIKARAPQAVLVFDKFHIVRYLMEAVDPRAGSGGRRIRGAPRCATSRGWCVATKTTSSTISGCPSTTAPSKD